MNQNSEQNTELTGHEELFCQLYVNGGHGYTGEKLRCYGKAFNDDPDFEFYDKTEISIKSNMLMRSEKISKRIRELTDERQAQDESIAIKMQMTDTLLSIMSETSRAQYKDKFGVKLSPAPLRAVSVNAARLLADLYPIKHETENKLKIEAEGGIIFNVIAPVAKTERKDEGETEEGS